MSFQWSDAQQVFPNVMSGYQPRPHQDALAEMVFDCIRSGDHLLGQAGCGTGKSYVGILAAASRAKATGTTVLYATATKALQDQVAGKDMPFLAENVFPFTYAVLKGRSNFVCLAKLSEAKFATVEAVRSELDDNHSGEFDSLSTPLDYRDKAALTTSSDECPGRQECPFGQVCFAEKAKIKASKADVVVVNHASLAIDLKIKKQQKDAGIPEAKVTGMLPKFSGVIVDEGHELEEYVRNGLSTELTERSVSLVGSSLADLQGKESAPLVKALAAVTKEFFDALRLEFQATKKGASSVALSAQSLSKLSDPLIAITKVLSQMEGSAEGMTVRGDDKLAQKRTRFIKRTRSAQEKIIELLTAGTDDLVRWIENDDRRGVMIKAAPLFVGDFLRDELWSTGPGIVISATLSVGGDFSHMATSLGLDD